jgi:hypothetical protein
VCRPDFDVPRAVFIDILSPMKLSVLSILLGLGMGLPQVYGLAKPAKFADAVKRFPRNFSIGVALMMIGTLW